MSGMPSTSLPVLEARDLAASRNGDAGPLRVLDGVDLAVTRGTLTDVVGPSGAGKTTLLLALARLLPGVRGELFLEGEPATAVDPRSWRLRVAYLPQRSALLPGTVEASLMLPWRLKVRAGADAPSPSSARAALDRVHLSDVALDRDVDRLSEGQAARVALLRCVLTRPDVLLLDEPDAALDDESADRVGLLTREFVDGGGAVLRVRHHRSDGLAGRRLRLSSGKLSEEAL
jgi:putative ABC transport system ATP-binding protein